MACLTFQMKVIIQVLDLSIRLRLEILACKMWSIENETRGLKIVRYVMVAGTSLVHFADGCETNSKQINLVHLMRSSLSIHV